MMVLSREEGWGAEKRRTLPVRCLIRNLEITLWLLQEVLFQVCTNSGVRYLFHVSSVLSFCVVMSLCLEPFLNYQGKKKCPLKDLCIYARIWMLIGIIYLKVCCYFNSNFVSARQPKKKKILHLASKFKFKS